MALWECASCGTPFAVGMDRCPQCGETEAYEIGDESMAKISTAGGPTNADEPVESTGAPGGDAADMQLVVTGSAEVVEGAGRDPDDPLRIGTVDEVLAWVDEVPDQMAVRAQRALDYENDQDDARSTLVTALKGRLARSEDETS